MSAYREIGMSALTATGGIAAVAVLLVVSVLGAVLRSMFTGNYSPAAKEVVLVVQPSPTLELPRGIIDDIADMGRAVAGVNTTIIISDSTPSIVFSQEFHNTRLSKMPLADYVADIRQAVATAQFHDAENNLLGGISLAAARLWATGGGQLVVLNSGLQTVRPLPFDDGLLQLEAGQVVNCLDKSGLLPNLKGVVVIFPMLGIEEGGTRPITEADKEKLTQVWLALVIRSGANLAQSPGQPIPTVWQPQETSTLKAESSSTRTIISIDYPCTGE